MKRALDRFANFELQTIKKTFNTSNWAFNYEKFF